MKNKRKTERVTCLVPVEGKEGGVFDLSKTIDISKTGIGFVSQKKIPLNKKIAIELDFNQDGDPVFVIGRVQWVHPIADTQSFRVGLRFTDLRSSSRSRLGQYFNS